MFLTRTVQASRLTLKGRCRAFSELAKAIRQFREDEEKEKTILEPEFGDFMVVHTEGTAMLELSKEYDGETINVFMDVRKGQEEDNFEDEEEIDEEVNEEEGGEVSMEFEVEISKETTGNRLMFDCIARGGDLEITDISIISEPDEMQDEAYNTVPAIRLSEEVIDGFYDYLAERGVDEKLAEYLCDAADQVDTIECANWAARVEAFLEK
mmetsp:Transcript_12932/g.25308  ORF Transcript_12932/g.25308 Transcript_12932/m.25308 type:complete len:210 (-) Transcript_12932:165-794(-)